MNTRIVIVDINVGRYLHTFVFIPKNGGIPIKARDTYRNLGIYYFSFENSSFFTKSKFKLFLDCSQKKKKVTLLELFIFSCGSSSIAEFKQTLRVPRYFK